MANLNLPKGPIDRVFVSTAGDPSVGIQGNGATIEGPWLLDPTAWDPDELVPALEDFRHGIGRAFSELWGEEAQVVFDYEIPGAAGTLPPESGDEE